MFAWNSCGERSVNGAETAAPRSTKLFALHLGPLAVVHVPYFLSEAHRQSMPAPAAAPILPQLLRLPGTVLEGNRADCENERQFAFTDVFPKETRKWEDAGRALTRAGTPKPWAVIPADDLPVILARRPPASSQEATSDRRDLRSQVDRPIRHERRATLRCPPKGPRPRLRRALEDRERTLDSPTDKIRVPASAFFCDVRGEMCRASADLRYPAR
jgi:hypothetical protein